MKRSNHISARTKNPVGGDLPINKLDVPLWQIFVALFLIAILLTCFKIYERNKIAPLQPIAWKAFDMDRFQQEQKQRRNLLVWIQSEPTDATLNAYFEAPSVRTANYMNRCSNFRINAADLVPNSDLAAWIERYAREVRDGGLVFWSAGQHDPVCLRQADFTIDTIVALLENN